MDTKTIMVIIIVGVLVVGGFGMMSLGGKGGEMDASMSDNVATKANSNQQQGESYDEMMARMHPDQQRSSDSSNTNQRQEESYDEMMARMHPTRQSSNDKSDVDPSNSPTGAPGVLTIAMDSKNLGDVSQSKGKISTDFTVVNEGEGDLIITGMDTSCMCTSAQIIAEEGKGPVYGMSMHGSPTGRSTIAPGESAILRVFYDPNVHGELRGPITRLINIMSNAGSKQIRISLNQVS